ncbi:hypothetical protein B0J18DRAFT_445923 [Chaetomium sp. MPI-SDFR-AT-0129]|nr:hypothetical protein B0J18DRAFT_445923 [Chaetomium sp. MPI-SDFR-AT-0129]
MHVDSLERKRKLPDGRVSDDQVDPTQSEPTQNVKKIRLTASHAVVGLRSCYPEPSSSPTLDKSFLPAEVWHHVFTFCPPRSLGNLLAVNKLFNVYLDPASSVHRAPHRPANQGTLRTREPNAIWRKSRGLFWPQMPAPMDSKTELDMWRLACSPKCQGCGKLRALEPDAHNSRHPGPGDDGVVVVWGFGRCLCALCLLKCCHKELDLQISPSIPSIIIPALSFIFLTQERDVFSAAAVEQTPLPDGLSGTKLFLKADVENLQEEFSRVQEMGQGTISEWLKGLTSRGSDAQHQPVKWERWEASGGVSKMRSVLYPGFTARAPTSLPPKPLLNPNLAQSTTPGRHERTAEEAAEIKAARKAEIERRSLLLDPPLRADVLRRIPAFQAATHIVAPLTDDAWDRLKPRLLAQRADAEALEIVRKSVPIPRTEHSQPCLETTLAAGKEARDLVDKHWEEVQAPLRAKIAGYADEVLRDDWNKGKKVTKENCSRFAVDALLHVRARFYAHVSKTMAAAKLAGTPADIDPPEGPFTQKLTLENMKWIFDTKFKPHTEHLRKELFYCNGCEGNYKAFGFEGVIQHYAAKHTKTLSVGSIIVHWRAEWPEHPPFSATPRTAQSPFHPLVPSGFPPVGSAPLAINYPYPPSELVPPPPPAPSPGYPYPTGYEFPPPVFNGPYQQPPPPHPHAFHPQHPAQFPAPPLPPPRYGQLQPPYATPPGPYQGFQSTAAPYGLLAGPPDSTYGPPQNGQYDYLNQYAPSMHPPFPDLYTTKVDDIARNSREVWRALGDIKDFPGDARVWVTIHHTVKRFQSRFYETPLLSMFIDGLSNHKEMRPVRNVNELICKTCHLALDSANGAKQDRKEFSLPQLANHFQLEHSGLTQGSAAASDWAVDMVWVRNLSRLPQYVSSANEPQRALVSAALPPVPELPPVPTASQAYAIEPHHSGPTPSVDGRATAATGALEVPQRKRHQMSSGLHDHSTPETLSKNGGSTYTDDGRRAPHASRPGKKGMPPKAETSTDGLFEKRFKKREENRKWEEERKREATSRLVEGAIGRAATPPAAYPSASTRRSGVELASRNQAGTQGERRASPQDGATFQAETRAEEFSTVATTHQQQLEEYEKLRQFRGHQGISESTRFTTSPSTTPLDSQSDLRRGEERTRTSLVGLAPPPADAPYHPYPAATERQLERYRHSHTQPSFVDRPHGHNGESYGLLAARPENRTHEAALPETDRPVHYDSIGLRGRPVVETYEIVHVIDEQGEYYIRRPLRREPEPRYVYQARRVLHETNPYPAGGIRSAPFPPPGFVPDAARAGANGGPDNRPGGRRTDPAYLEEYDPRFPAA